jgi:hypothetical protein
MPDEGEKFPLQCPIDKITHTKLKVMAISEKSMGKVIDRLVKENYGK